MSATWRGDACSLVDAYRSGDHTPLDELDATLDAIDCVGAERVQLPRPGTRPRRRAERRSLAALRRRAPRGQGARPGRRLARHRSVRGARRSDRRAHHDPRRAARRRRRRAGRAHGRVGVRRRQPDPHRAERHHPQPLAARPDTGRLVGRDRGRGRRWPRAARHRRRRWRLDPHPGGVLRPRRAQGDLRAHPAWAAVPHRCAHGRGRRSHPVGARHRPLAGRRQRRGSP